MKKFISIVLCLGLLTTLAVIPASAATFSVTQNWETDIYAGGILDMYAMVDTGNSDSYTYQWQVDASLGDGVSWIDLEESTNAYGYHGVNTPHLQFITAPNGGYILGTGWENIPFRCKVTKNGESHTTSNMYMNILSCDTLPAYLERKGFGLFEPTVSGAGKLKTADYQTYTTYADAGTALNILCGSFRPENDPLLNRSNTTVSTEIWITENGKTVKGGSDMHYIPYTIGKDAVTVQIKLNYKMGINDLGCYETKTIFITTEEPSSIGSGTARSDISLLKEMYSQSQKLASIPKDTVLKITQQTGGWYQVVYNGYVGYVATSSVNFQAGSDPVIRHVDLTITEPVVGKTPPYGVTVSPDTCYASYVDWYDNTANRFLVSGDKFQAGHSYDLIVWANAKDGYSFDLNSREEVLTTAIINGHRPAFVSKAYEQIIGQVVEIRYTFSQPAAQEPEVHTHKLTTVQRVEPTCSTDGHEAYFHCDCGADFADGRATEQVDVSTWGILPATGHVVSEWRTTQVYHYTVCTKCGEFLTQEDHIGGTATCTEKAACVVCGYRYGREEPDHRWGPGWDYRDSAGHGWVCADCKEHSQLQAHIPGPEATETTPQVCKECGYVIAPEKGHTHSLTNIPAKKPTCTEPGNIDYFACDGCGHWFADSKGTTPLSAVDIAPTGHTVFDWWAYDNDHHWYICAYCEAVLGDGKLAHEVVDGQCTVCGFILTTELPTPEETHGTEATEATEATEPTAPTEPAADEPRNEWLLVVLSGLVCFALSVTVTVIVLKGKK